MTEAYPSNYWLSPTALYITLNALGEPNYIQANCSNGTQILVYVKGIIGYDNGHNYRRWNLQASPTLFGDSKAKYVYVAIPRSSSDSQAFVCFPSEEIDIYGKNAEEEQIGSTDYYYIWLQGIISATTGSDRTWSQNINTGTLSSDEAINAGGEGEWFQYSSVSQMVTFIKTVFSATINYLTIGKELIFGSKKVTDIADGSDLTDESSEHIATPAFIKKMGDNKYLRKDQDDETEYKLTMAEAQVNGKLDIFGNTSFGVFNKGLTGGNIDNNGNGELQSLVLRESLTVPKITYNCEEWIGGNTWRSQGGGTIKAVATVGSTHYALLDIKAGEGGKVAVDDKCQGIFHLTSGNETSDTDSKNGHFTFRGFKTIYFLVTSILSDTELTSLKDTLRPAFGLTDSEYSDLSGMNAVFVFKTRQEAEGTDQSGAYIWNDNTLPQPQMDFAAYANATTASRQQVTLTTPEYDLGLVKMTDWTYASSNIMYVCRNLDGFSVDCEYWDKDDKKRKTGTKSFSGYGIAFGNAYMWGNIEQFDRAPSLISQQLYKKALAKDSDVTVSDIGQSTDTQATKAYPYLWGYWHYTYSDGTESNSEVFLVSNFASDGTSVEIYGSFDKLTDLQSAYNETYAGTEKLVVGRGHGYIVQEDGHLWVFTVDTLTGSFSNDMQDAGQIKGDTGPSGTSAITCDLTDQMSAVAMTVDGKTIDAVTLSTNFYIYLGTTKQTLTSLNVTGALSGMTINTDLSTGLITVTVPKDTSFTNDALSLTVTGACANGTLSAVYNIHGVRAGAEGETPIIYSLSPADSYVKVDKKGAYSTDSLFCFVDKQDGNEITKHVDYGTIKVVLDEIEDDFLFDDGEAILYDDDTDLGGATMYDYDPTTGFIIGGSYKPSVCVKFILYSPTGVLLDVENVPVVIDGEDGTSPHIGDNGDWYIGTEDTGIKATPDDPDVWTIGADGYWYFNGVRTKYQAIGHDGQAVLMSYAFKRSSTVLTDAPEGGSFSSPHPTTEGWSDGVPDGTEPVYMSSRCFTSDGKDPQQSVWSTPCLMADTADIDICYNASTTKPSAPTEHGSQTSGGWHDEATSDDIWMAVSSKVGGTWGDWQISKIKGEKGDDGLNAAQPNLLDKTDSNKDGLGYWVDNGSGAPTLTDELYSDMKVIKSVWNSGAQYEYVNEGVSVRGIPVKSNTIYTYSVYIKSDVATYPNNAITLHVRCASDKNNGHFTLISYNNVIKEAGVWMRLYMTFKTEDASEQLYFTPYIYTGNTSIKGNYAYFCMPKLEECSEATPWCLSENDKIGADAVSCDLTDDMTSVAMDSDGKTKADITLTTTYHLYYGTEAQTLTSLLAAPAEGSPEGVTATANKSTGLVSVTIPAGTALTKDTLNVTVTGYCSIGTATKTRSVVFTVHGVRAGVNGDNAIMFELAPTATVVKEDKAGSRTPSSLSCYVTKNDGGSVTNIYTEADLPTGYYLKVGCDNDITTVTDYKINYSVKFFSSVKKNVTFYLYDNNNTLIDRETVPVVIDGKNLTNVKNFYKWGEDGTTAPTGTYSENEIPEHVEGVDYLWNYEECYDDEGGVISTSDKSCIGYFPQDGVGIDSVTEYYYKGTETAPDPITVEDKKTITIPEGWTTEQQSTDVDNRYIWNQEVVKLTDDTYQVGALHTAGVQGIQGESNLMADMDNEMQSIPCTNDGIPTATTVKTFTAHIWYGSTKQPLLNDTTVTVGGTPVPITGSKTDISGGTATAMKSGTLLTVKITPTANVSTLPDTCEVVCNLVCEKGSTTTTGVLVKAKAGTQGAAATYYDILPTATSVVRKEDGTCEPTYVSFSANKHVGETLTNITKSTTGCCFFIGTNGTSTPTYIGESTIPSHTITEDDTSIEFYIYSSSATSSGKPTGTLLDKETIRIVQDGTAGADADQSNLFGYDTTLVNCNNADRFVHTAKGVAGYVDVEQKDSNMHWAVGLSGILTSGKTYAVSGKVTSPVAGTLRVQLAGTTVISDTIKANTAFSFVGKKAAGSSDNMYVRVQVTPDYPCDAYAGLVIIENLKIEDATNLNGTSTPFIGLAADTIPQGQNIIYDAQFKDSSKWDVWYASGKSIANQVNALNGYAGTFSVGANSYINLLQQDVIGRIKANTWYTFSYWSKFDKPSDTYDVHLATYIYPTMNGYVNTNGVSIKIDSYDYYGVDERDDYKWTRDINNFLCYKSGAKGINNGVSTMKVTLTNSTSTARSLQITVKGSSEASCDYVYVTKILYDSESDLKTAISSSKSSFLYLYAGAGDTSGNNVFTVEVASNGSVTLYIGYSKNSSGNQNDDQYSVQFAKISSGLAVTDNTPVITGIDNNYHLAYNDSNGVWKRHTFTFRSPNILPDNCYILWRLINNSSATRTRTAYICMPKLEECEKMTTWQQNEEDRKGSTGAMVRPCGTWSEKASYVYNDDFCDVVIYKDVYYAVANQGNNPPKGTLPTDTDYWKPADQMKFVATELLLAQKSYIEKLLLNYAEAQDADGNTTISINGTTGVLTAVNAVLTGANVSGVIKSNMIYTPPLVLSNMNYTVNPTTQAYSSFLLLNYDGKTTPSEKTITLPPASDMPGVELSFFLHKMNDKIDTVIIATSNGEDIYFNNYEGESYFLPNILTSRSKCVLRPSNEVVFKSYYDRWYVVSGFVRSYNEG